ncbi:hypothetical protein ACH4PU_32710 [Streptomyces sp. NPDC021100]|uniref:hypothetical protein n=1 Tax=Streptomyces sp. NPDC021100 TaxID=3365114 RepID=UPI003787FC60
MLSTEAQHLYPGAVVMNDPHLDTVATVTRENPGKPAVRVTFEPADPHTLGRTSWHAPEEVLPTTAVAKVVWEIRYHHRPGKHLRGAPARSSSRLSAVYTVRDFHAHRAPHLIVDEIAEEHSVMTYRPIRLEDLPGPDEPTPAPPGEHGARFSALHRIGPTVLATGDAVRARLARLQEIHVREHGPVREDRGICVRRPAEDHFTACERCVTPGPYAGTVFEVTIERTYHRVTLDDLPTDWDFELGPAMAHVRHQAMRTARRLPAHRAA